MWKINTTLFKSPEKVTLVKMGLASKYLAGCCLTFQTFNKCFYIRQISFQKTGLGSVSGEMEGVGPVLTLKETIDTLGDSGRVISYLKVDIEGAELKAIQEWIDSGILNQVSQIGIELHTQPESMSKDELANLLKDLLDAMRKLHEMGFRLISLFNNECGGKSSDYEGRYLVYFEVVFYRIL